MNTKTLSTDAGALIFLLLVTAFFAISFVDFSIAPYEDAAMLMRYAQHLAEGHGIVWNIGEPPVDGATDFLYMVVLSCLVWLGWSVEFASRFLGFSSHLLIVWIVYLASRSLFNVPTAVALVTSLYLTVGPGLHYVAAYFGTPFFALFAAITWWAALRIIERRDDRRSALLFALASLVTALIRPEGVILTGLMLAAIAHVRGFKSSRAPLVFYFGLFLSLGGVYLGWRWRYFGSPLPNPFYKKGGGSLHLDGLRESVRNTIILGGPFLLTSILGLYSVKTRRFGVGVLIPVAGFASAFILLSSETNFGARFQYALLPLVLMVWWPLASAVREDLRLPRWAELSRPKQAVLSLFGVALSAALLGYQYHVGRASYFRDGRYEVGVALSEYRDKHLSIATTEAGLVPLYSRWRALDTWGLNDRWIAHHGGITTDYLARFNPDVIMFHEHFSPIVPVAGNGKWFEMVMVLKRYAEKNGYILAAAYGDSPYESHYYYVRPDLPESSAIVDRIRSIDYHWATTGRRAINYALLRKQ
jgi:arabinofuranosyltransferase